MDLCTYASRGVNLAAISEIHDFGRPRAASLRSGKTGVRRCCMRRWKTERSCRPDPPPDALVLPAALCHRSSMCGRFTANYTWAELVELYRLSDDMPARNLEPRYNAAPTQEVPVCRLGPDGKREIVSLRWGLIPFWAKDEKIGYKTINARAETAHEKPAFRDAFKKRRCLIPTNGWYEWREEGDGKQPYLLSLPTTPFSLAGLWESWKGADGYLQSFTIVVGSAAPEIAEYHDRMPVVLLQDQYDEWLSQETDAGVARDLLGDVYAGPFDVRKVSRRVNSPRNDDPDLIEAA